MRRFLAVITVVTGFIAGGLMAYAAPIDATVPKASSASLVIPVHGMMNGFECFWYKGCKYCRANPQSQWMLYFCKEHHG
jgi:hypothetical protein